MKSLLEIVCKIFLPLSLSLRNFLLLLLLTNLIFGQNNLFANSNRPLAFVTNQGDDSVSVINLSDFKLIDTISVGKSPAGIVVDNINKLIFVSNAEGKSVSVIDYITLKVINTIKFEGSSVGLDVSHNGSLLFITDWFNDKLLVYSIPSFDLLEKIAVGKAPAGVVAARSGLVYVVNRDENNVSVVSTDDFSVKDIINVGDHPFGIALNPKEDKLIVANVQSHDVTVIDLLARSKSKTIKVGKRPYCISFSPTKPMAYVTNQYEDSVSIIDLSINNVVKTIPVGSFPEGIANWRGYILVVNWMDEEMMILDEDKLDLINLIPLGSNPRNFGKFIFSE